MSFTQGPAYMYGPGARVVPSRGQRQDVRRSGSRLVFATGGLLSRPTFSPENMSSERHPSIDSPNGAPQPSSHASRPSAGGAPTPAPRSCVTCRRRKVKCDKNNPCSNCVRAKIECIFPGPGRAPRKSRKPSDAELLERLRRLEGVVISLNAQVEGHEHDAADRDKQRQSSAGLDNRLYHKTAAGPTAQDGDHGAINDNVDGLESRFGRLVIEKGRSRYINNSFWASLNNEVRLHASALAPTS